MARDAHAIALDAFAQGHEPMPEFLALPPATVPLVLLSDGAADDSCSRSPRRYDSGAGALPFSAADGLQPISQTRPLGS